MKRKFQAKQTKRKITYVFSFFAFIVGLYITSKILNHSPIKITDKKLVTMLLNKTTFTEKSNTSLNSIKELIKTVYSKPDKFLLTTTSKLIAEKKQLPVVKIKEDTSQISSTPPLIYIYNSHQTEEYAPSTFLEYSVKPTVMMADYIIEEIFNNNNYKTLVEESSIKQILNDNNWKYSYSYKASRLLLEQRIKENPSLTYFIDVHRDSLTKDRTTVEINGNLYAKIIFLIGLENPNYEANLDFTTKLNNCLNEKYPNLSKGIYKKGGAGVNGVYNQDFSPYTILIEIGGYENTTTEVMNSSIAFSNCFMEAITTHEGKTTS